MRSFSIESLRHFHQFFCKRESNPQWQFPVLTKVKQCLFWSLQGLQKHKQTKAKADFSCPRKKINFMIFDLSSSLRISEFSDRKTSHDHVFGIFRKKITLGMMLNHLLEGSSIMNIEPLSEVLCK